MVILRESEADPSYPFLSHPVVKLLGNPVGYEPMFGQVCPDDELELEEPLEVEVVDVDV